MTMTWEMLHQHLMLAEANVAIGEQFIAQQKETLRKLEWDGRDVIKAWRRLRTLEQLQVLYVADRDRLVKELAALELRQAHGRPH